MILIGQCENKMWVLFFLMAKTNVKLKLKL